MSEAWTGYRVECKVCGLMKAPRGRSAPLSNAYCDHECMGYAERPFPLDLWPGETSEDFGYPCSDPNAHPTPNVHASDDGAHVVSSGSPRT